MKALAWLPALLAAGCIGLEPLINDSAAPDSGVPDDTGPDVQDYGDLSVTPATVDFGQITIGESGSATVVLAFDGDGDVIVESVGMGTGSSTFVIGSVASVPTTITADNDLIVELLFSPAREQDYEGKLVITTDHYEATEIEVPLMGEGVGEAGAGPDISVSPNSIDFGLVDVGVAESRTLSVSNIGSEAFFLTQISVDHPGLDWDADFTMPLEFDPGESREVTVEWAPSAIGVLEAELTFESDVPGEERLVVPITGESDDICEICAPWISVDTGGEAYSMSFSALSMPPWPDTQTVRITNSGDQTLTIRDVYVNNDTLAPDGSFSTNWRGSSVSLEPWEQTTVEVTYSATGTAWDLPYELTDQNILHILSDAANEPDYAIQLNGFAL